MNIFERKSAINQTLLQNCYIKLFLMKAIGEVVHP
jgi:hypothetical protein